MKISVLASGSKGNTSYLESGNNKLLIDCGMPLPYISSKLEELNVELQDITGIFLTHIHDDHILGLKPLLSKHPVTVYLSQIMYDELKLKIGLPNYVILDTFLKLDNLEVNILKMSHDSGDVNAFIFKEKEVEAVYITDTGYINARYHRQLQNKDIYIMESNHDINMLMNGSYPHHLKRRITSDKGHLSNIDSAIALSKFIGNKTKKIILIHLSENNNTKEIAKETLEKMLSDNNLNFKDIVISTQNEKTELIVVD